MRVETYFNLHKKCLSYRPTTKGGKVQHASALVLNDVKLVVQPAGRAKVLRNKSKNVHAFVRGQAAFVRPIDFTDDGDLSPTNMERQGYRPVTYNPYKYESFVMADTGEAIHSARQIVLIGKRMWKVA